jgi:23S rRNA (uridine2552-2'-O)-methyltransferase
MKGKSSNRGIGGAASRRQASVRVKTAKGRKISSILWLERQLNDPYVRAAKAEGYRSRAAYKLIQLNEKYKLLKPGMRVVDLGAAPGGWTQVVADKIKLEADKKAQLVAVDILKMGDLPGTIVMKEDFTDNDVPDKIKALLGGPVDLVLSDMAAEGTGHKATDHIRIMALAEMAYQFAHETLGKGGSFVCKLFQGGGEGEFMKGLKADFAQVHFSKPDASRPGAETYVVAKGFKGRKAR